MKTALSIAVEALEQLAKYPADRAAESSAVAMRAFARTTLAAITAAPSAPEQPDPVNLPKWIDDAKGKDPFTDDLIAYAVKQQNITTSALLVTKQANELASEMLAQRDEARALLASQPAAGLPDVDSLAQFIRQTDGAHALGAGALAEKIFEWLQTASQPADSNAKDHAVQQEQIWAMEAKTQRSIVLAILSYFGLPPNDWEALRLIKAKIESQPAAPVSPEVWVFETCNGDPSIATWHREAFFHPPQPAKNIRNVVPMGRINAATPAAVVGQDAGAPGAVEELRMAHDLLDKYCVAQLDDGLGISLMARIEELYSWYAKTMHAYDGPVPPAQAVPSESVTSTYAFDQMINLYVSNKSDAATIKEWHAAGIAAASEKPFHMPGAWFPVGVLGHPMREFPLSRCELAHWPSEAVQEQDAVIAAEAKLYRDLTGDAMAMGHDGVPAALQALKAAQGQDGAAAMPKHLLDFIYSADLYSVLMEAQNNISSQALPSMANKQIRRLDDLKAELATPLDWDAKGKPIYFTVRPQPQVVAMTEAERKLLSAAKLFAKEHIEGDALHDSEVPTDAEVHAADERYNETKRLLCDAYLEIAAQREGV